MLALHYLLHIKKSHDDQRAIKEHVAAISIGLKDGCPLLDLDYEEDSSTDTDLNVVMMGAS